jgi:hypothetical protein
MAWMEKVRAVQELLTPIQLENKNFKYNCDKKGLKGDF